MILIYIDAPVNSVPYGSVVIVVMRFRPPESSLDAFGVLAEQAASHFARAEGCLSQDLAQNIDEPELWVLVTRWRDVGAYRRAIGGYDAKLVLTPLSAWSIDEPSAYDAPESVGLNIPRSR